VSTRNMEMLSVESSQNELYLPGIMKLFIYIGDIIKRFY